ncbi:MAG: hypothetical protein M3R38_37965, partial [Actinomycetota bacterium]|nr:hypothetical protein [Actinomycetota bacterium]
MLAPKVYEVGIAGVEGGLELTPQGEVDRRHRPSFEAGGVPSETARPGLVNRGALRGRVRRLRPEDLGIGELFERVRDAIVVA